MYRFLHQEEGAFIAHSAYLVNLATDSEETRDLIEKSLLNDLLISEACASLGVVVHFGNYKGQDVLRGYQNILMLLNKILELWDGNCLLLLENQAGRGGSMGTSLEEMVIIRNLLVESEKVGFCFDTCHAFASGLWSGGNWPDIEARGKELGYFEHVAAVHLNDSQFPSGSFRDRHANVGKGHIGEENMKTFLHSSFVSSIPVMLETPSSQSYMHEEEIKYYIVWRGISNVFYLEMGAMFDSTGQRFFDSG